MVKPFFYDDEFMWNTLGIEELPKILHQYTNLDSLEKILENQTILFSRLDNVNDPEEATAADMPAAATSIFVSCWTSEESESIPMWSMYGHQLQGVRLSMPSNMFLGRAPASVFEKGGAKTVVTSDWTISRKSPAMAKSGRCLIGPNKVHYSNASEFRNSNIVHTDGKEAHCFTYDLGMVKSEHWSYEQEWRFKLSWFPEEIIWPDDDYFRSVSTDLERYPITTEQVFVPLDPSILESISIVRGPLMSDADASKLNKIVQKYAPKASIDQSSIPLRRKPGKA